MLCWKPANMHSTRLSSTYTLLQKFVFVVYSCQIRPGGDDLQVRCGGVAPQRTAGVSHEKLENYGRAQKFQHFAHLNAFLHKMSRQLFKKHMCAYLVFSATMHG